MGSFFGILFLIILLLVLLGPYLSRWFGPIFQRWILGKMEDRMRRMAGMPTRKEERKARKKGGQRRSRRRTDGVTDEWRQAVRPKENPVDFMRIYAEDVEFEEIKETTTRNNK